MRADERGPVLDIIRTNGCRWSVRVGHETRRLCSRHLVDKLWHRRACDIEWRLCMILHGRCVLVTPGPACADVSALLCGWECVLIAARHCFGPWGLEVLLFCSGAVGARYALAGCRASNIQDFQSRPIDGRRGTTTLGTEPRAAQYRSGWQEDAEGRRGIEFAVVVMLLLDFAISEDAMLPHG